MGKSRPEVIRRAARIGNSLRGYRGAQRAIAAARPVATASPTVYFALLRLIGRESATMLDVGTGLMDSLDLFPCPVKLGLDAHRPYLEHRRKREAVPINADALSLSELFVDRAVDLVALVDVVEHFEEEVAREVLRQAEAVARRRVVLTTPRGPFPQSGYDAFGLGGEELQRHRSVWDVRDLTELGYRVVVLKKFHDRRNESFVAAFGADAEPVDALVAWKDRRQSPR
jgi:hypothetical protein